MTAILARLKNEPALLGAVTVIAGTFGVTVPTGSGWAGLGLAVGEAVVGLVVRRLVTPNAKVPGSGVQVPAPVVTPPAT